MENFDQLTEFDDQIIQETLQKIDYNELALALHQTSTAVKEKFFKNMSPAGMAALFEAFEALGSPDDSAVNQAKSHIHDLANED